MKSLLYFEQLTSSALFYAKLGWSVLLLKDAGTPDAKEPRKKSKGYKDATTNPEQIRDLLEKFPNANIGIATGESSGFFALDIDPRNGGDESLQALEKKYGELPQTVRQITGGGGEHILFKQPEGIKFKNQTGKPGCGLDVKTDGGYIVVEPSIHPNGRPYAFDLEHHPEEVEIAEAPEWLLKLLTSNKQMPSVEDMQMLLCKKTTAYGRKALLAEAERIINAPIGEQEITLNTSSLKIGGLFKAGHIEYIEAFTTLVDAGLGMSNDPAREPWTASAIISKVRRALAQANPRLNVVKNSSPINPEQFNALPEISEAEVLPVANEVPNEILNPPGVFGQYVQYINQTSRFQEPWLALAAAIPLFGTIKAHKIQTWEGLRTNIYSLGIAPSGTGKEDARKINQQTLETVGLIELLAGDPGSTEGLFQALHDRKGRSLMQIDEFGPFLNAIMGKNAPSYFKGLGSLLMRLFTSGNAKFYGKEYSKRHKDSLKERQDIDQPNLSIYGTTAPIEFYGALGSADAMSGFLPRMLLFEVQFPQLSPNKYRTQSSLPQEVLDELLKWKNQSSNPEPTGNLDAFVSIRPKKIAFEPEAQALLDQLSLEMRQKAFHSSNINTGRDAIYNRIAEHSNKLALVATDYDAEYISVETTQWAIKVAQHSAAVLFRALENHIADNAIEANFKKVLNVLRNRGTWMSSTELSRKTQTLRPNERKEILKELEESGQIESKLVKTTTNCGTHYRIAKNFK